MEKFDLVVIGAGPGGYPAAIRGAQLGASVAVVEKERLGGTCLNWGCIPTKLLIAGSDLYESIRHADAFGIRTQGCTFDYSSMADRKNQVVEKLRSGVGQLLASNGVKVFQGEGSFFGRNRILIQGAEGEVFVEAGKTIIATGSVSAMPGFLPRHPRVVESRAFLERRDLPASAIVLGGGVIGCEFACMLAQFRVKTTIVEMLEDILAPLDADVRRELRRHMEERLGIRILTGAPFENISADDAAVRGTARGESLEAEMLLVAVGRHPVTEGLNLRAVGLQTVKPGTIPVDEHCQTRSGGIYAIGDVTAGLQLAHRATSQGIIAAENACGPKPAPAETVVPSCIFTSPEIGSVGMTEQEAKATGLSIKVGKFPFAALGKSLAIGKPYGFVKWVADAETDRLLGAHAIGAHATDLIAEATLAIRSEQTAEELGRTIHCHPTLSEAWLEAAHAVHGQCVHLPAKRKT